MRCSAIGGQAKEAERDVSFSASVLEECRGRDEFSLANSAEHCESGEQG
jgi:hypothetical protein